MTRRGWAATILTAWAASLGWLVQREFFRSTGARLAEAALSVPPGAAYYRLDVGQQQVGFSSSTIDTVGATIQVTDVLVLDVPALGVMHHTGAMSRATVTRSLRLQRMDVRMAGDLGRFAARGIVSGDTLLTVTLLVGADSQITRVPLPRPIVLPTLMPLRLAFSGTMKPGKTYAVRVFDPFLLAARDVEVTVAAESTLVIADSAGYDSTALAWVPAHFDTVRAFRIEERWGGTPAGFTLERSAFELAFTNFRKRDTARAARASAGRGAGDVVAATAIAAGAALRPRSPSQLRVRLSRVDLANFDLSSGRQRLAGDTLIVQREAPAQLVARYDLPARGAGGPGEPGGPGGPLAAFLAPEPLIQSDDPRIQAQARRILGGERDPARAARLLLDWVHDHVTPTVTGSAPSAVQALETRRGDCNELTVLFAALARAAGLPARAAAGLLQLGDRFYYHAWPEVYLGDWVAVDPVLGQFPADAAHLRFTVGGLARQAELVRLIGRLRLEVL